MLKRLQQYLLNRSQYQPSITLSNRNIYILPTKQGLFFALVLLLMLLTAINFSNSLIFMMTFFLASLFMVSMLITQKSLLGLSFYTSTAEPVFCQQLSHIPLHIKLSQGHKNLAASLTIKLENSGQTIDLLDHDDSLKLAVKTTHRGYIKIPPITVSSTFPFGLFYAWSTLKLNTHSLAYPQPIASTFIIKTNQLIDKEGENDHHQGMEDFSGLDIYIKGQSLKHVHWKAFAKQQGMYVKNFSGGAQTNKYLLDFDLFEAHVDFEIRLNYLTYFILEAEKKGDYYGLKIAKQQLSIQRGDVHKHVCLKMLAIT